MKRWHQYYFFIIPVVLAVSFPLTLYSKNLGQIPTSQIFLPVLVVVVATACFSGIVMVMLHSIWKSIVFASAAVILFFTYADFLSAIGQKAVFRLLSGVSPSLQIFAANMIVLSILFFVLHRVRKIYTFPVIFFGILSFVSTVFPLISIGSYILKYQYIYPTSSLEISRPPDLKSVEDFPDIYYIVPDTHASADVMKKYYGYDMDQFLNQLEQRGFTIINHSTSNYPKTLLSLASSLNMEYLDYLSDLSPADDETLIYPLIEKNNVVTFLKSLGYAYYQLGSWWPGTRANRLADRNIVVENEYLVSVNGFTYALLSMTMIRPFITEHLSQFFLGESENDKLSRIVYQFSHVEEVARLPGPKFVFFHIIAPHSPFVFDRFCTNIDPGYSKTRTSVVNYAEQAECIDTKLVSMIDTIQRVSSNSAVIILQSDEGADFFGGNNHWTEVSAEAIQSKFPILHAIYLPQRTMASLSQTMTPVNIFRVVFNSYFHTNMPLLPDKNIIYPDKNSIYKHIDVTDIVRDKIN